MKKTTDEKNIITEIKKTTEELLTMLKTEGKVEVGEEKSNEESNYIIKIETQETGLLIGYHGETLNSLQLLLGVILFKKLGKWVHVVVDVGNYRQMREESIKEMVNRIVSEVEATNQGATLPYLSPLERRIVHMMLTNHGKVVSESVGEGKDRRLTIRPK
ncbi:KH domain-containing protein [Candidatus Gottesmanbacteria bacterium]|nr:KH domain-containing protein [Candidatus Gottesmanbacteria bacterium]